MPHPQYPRKRWVAPILVDKGKCRKCGKEGPLTYCFMCAKCWIEYRNDYLVD